MRLEVNQKLDLKLAMTKQLRQAIELLQMPSDELETFLIEQSFSNPLIEVKDSFHFKEGYYTSKNTNLPENNAEYRISNVDRLLSEIRLTYHSSEDYQLLQQFILNLNEFGYLPNATQLFSESQYNHALQLLKNLDYVGVGATNLRHCLLLQLEAFYPDELFAKKIIQYHLEKLADRKWNDIKKCLQIDEEELKYAINIIKSLNPRPFKPDYSSMSEVIRPDIIIDIKDDFITYALSNWFSPSITMTKIESMYLSAEEQKQMNKWEKDYNWLSQSLEQRRETMIAIMEYLIQEQLDALKNGLQFIKPMTLKDISVAINRHESTVSRATMNKYIQAPWGTFLMKNLFSSKVTTHSGEDISKEKIKTQILELVKNENKKKPLSDNKILELICSQEEIELSRRTIAKYRDELNIPSSSKRKEL